MPAYGAERLLVEILRYRNAAHRYHLLCLVAGGELVPDVQALGIPVTVLNKKPGIDLRHAWELYRWLSQHKPTIVHTHQFASDTWGKSCAWLARVPGIFSTAHSTKARNSWLHLKLDHALLKISTKIIVCSTQVAKTLSAQNISADKVISISSGVDLERIAQNQQADLSSQFAIADDATVFALVGQPREAQDYTDLLPVLAEIARSGRRFVVLVIGEEEPTAEIRNGIHKYQLDKQILFAGSRKDITRILKSTDYLLLPSSWEGLPMTLLESMACGTPALATRVGGIPDVIQHGVNGLLYEAGDVEGLAQGLHHLLDNRDDALDMRAAAQRTIANRYSAQSIAAAYDGLYCEVG